MLKKPRSSLFRKYCLITTSIILVTLFFFGIALIALVCNLWLNEKESLLTENTCMVAENTSNVFGSDLLEESSRGSIAMVCNSLKTISEAIDADLFIVNKSGKVIYCKESLHPDMQFQTSACFIHGEYLIPQTILDTVSQKNSYIGYGDLDGRLSSTNIVVAYPIIINDKVAGAVVSTQSIIDGLSSYIATILILIFISALVALAFGFLITYLVSKKLTMPLRQMSAAAKQYADGDFSATITTRKRPSLFAHDEIDELADAFNTMSKSLSSQEQTRRSFVTNISHELKTPMTTIGGFIDGILDGTIEPSKQNQYLKIVSDEVKRLSRLVTGMLNMSKLEAGELDINPSSFDISEMIFQTLLSFEQVIDTKHIDIRGLDTMDINTVLADKDMINQVVYNLVDNAVKFTPDGGYIEVSSMHDAEKIIVKIKNSGKGIEQEEIDKIFERFYKVDKSRSYDTRGAGMGLFLVKTIIELHGGRISCLSEVGEYTEFVFNIPLS